ncbi:hypothetical protein [Paenibacillus sp. DS2015]|uniref:hypothetical protein n=1 Tax=Paenibacillus sp. DS2015 TaxID=3373917 RepID=UPI003D233834
MMTLFAIIFQCQQNSQYSGVSGSKLDHDLAPYVAKSFAKKFNIGLHYFSENIPSEDQEITQGNLTLANAHPRSFFLLQCKRYKQHVNKRQKT